MLNSKGFDLWADGYDASVAASDAEDSYPFAGYKKVLAEVYRAVRQRSGLRILDIGFGTGVLAQRLYADGYDITGVDFSPQMLAIARQKMPQARLLEHDFSTGLPAQLAGESFDHILCTYAIHHLSRPQQVAFLEELLTRLAPGGQILLGDVAFADNASLERCRAQAGDTWDDEEYYPVAQDLLKHFPTLGFTACSDCAGILALKQQV